MNNVLHVLAEAIKLNPGDIGYNPSIKCTVEKCIEASSLAGILNTVYLVAGMIAVLIIVIAGFFYITANGDSNQITKAKNTILYAVIGLVVVMFAFVITQFVISKVAG